MFTGIVTATGRIAGIEMRGGDRRMRIASRGVEWREFRPGESIAVNGVCLTAVTLSDDGFSTDVSNETCAVTTLGKLSTGSCVNLEPALALGERLGGHLVSGHVDGVGELVACRDDGRALCLTFEAPAAIARYIAKKGSICIDGVSLTVNDVSGPRFDVTIIPHTQHETILSDYRVGTSVNIEVDLMARYLERLLGSGDGDRGITRDFLKARGYG